jgi:tetratricopeptide (TPR) repeat protein
MIKKILFSSMGVFFIWGVFSSVSFVAAQSRESAQVDSAIDVIATGQSGSKKENPAAVEKLKNMTAEQMAKIDDRLERAMGYYYENEFDLALPILQKIAEEIETVDIMFWLATSAMETGQYNLAVTYFQKIIGIDSDYHDARLGLIKTYIQMGETEAAIRELDLLEAVSPPAAVQQKIDLLRAGVVGRKKLIWNLRLSQGYLWDSNVSYGPSDDNFRVIGGTLLPDRDLLKQRDQASVTGVRGNIAYDFGDAAGFIWNTEADFYNYSYVKYSRYNRMKIDLNTGPWWVGERFFVKVPFGVSEYRLGNDQLNNRIHVDPSFEYYFCRYFSLYTRYSFGVSDYYDGRNTALDNKHHQFEIKPTFYFYPFGQKHQVSAIGGYNNHNADNNQYSYDGFYWGFSYYTKFVTQTHVLLDYRYVKKCYDDNALPFYMDRRKDRQESISAVLSQDLSYFSDYIAFLKNFYVSVIFDYTDNESNLGLYEYDRAAHQVIVGYRF